MVNLIGENPTFRLIIQLYNINIKLWIIRKYFTAD
jgi:hypothetical protein